MQIFILVTGKVQGVFFRASVKKLADRMKIVGYAKNLSNGQVEIVAQANKQCLDQFLQELKHACTNAKISNIEYRLQEEKTCWNEFTII